MMLATSNLTNSFITISFILGFSWCCDSREGRAPSSKRIRCIQIDRSIPFKSAIVHTIAFLCFFNTSNKLSSWSFCRSEAMMTGRVSLDMRKAYLSLFGSGFNSLWWRLKGRNERSAQSQGRGSFGTLHG
jgi:hypothetical protein